VPPCGWHRPARGRGVVQWRAEAPSRCRRS
jgi:hypothetical protein